jgi:hypothetical protein
MVSVYLLADMEMIVKVQILSLSGHVARIAEIVDRRMHDISGVLGG